MHAKHDTTSERIKIQIEKRIIFEKEYDIPLLIYYLETIEYGLPLYTHISILLLILKNNIV